MAASASPAVADQASTTAASVRATVPFDLSRPPVIEGFSPLPMYHNEAPNERTMRKMKDNPIIPIGCLATAGVLMFGLRSFLQGKSRQSQMLMRGRIFAQGFTVTALVVGVIASGLKSK
ncbi:HIG1 domain family member 2A, mitochondrial [Vanacampus margaritifer]